MSEIKASAAPATRNGLSIGSWQVHIANLFGTRHGALGAGILLVLIVPTGPRWLGLSAPSSRRS